MADVTTGTTGRYDADDSLHERSRLRLEQGLMLASDIILRHNDATIRRPTAVMIAAETQPKESSLGIDTNSNTDDDETPAATEKTTNAVADVCSMAMIGTMGFYKQIISSLLPPACRFVPNCSQCGVQAVEQLGPVKGVILIAWRLLRCMPVGGKGHDPPRYVAYYTWRLDVLARRSSDFSLSRSSFADGHLYHLPTRVIEEKKAHQKSRFDWFTIDHRRAHGRL